MTEDLTATDGTQTYQYFVHVCGPLTQQTCATGVPGASTCQLTQQSVPYVNGEWPATAPAWFVENEGATNQVVGYMLSGQNNCAMVRTAYILFQCGDALITPVPVTLGTTGSQQCTQNFTITTPVSRRMNSVSAHRWDNRHAS
jgi:hypothetical protein